MHSTLPVLATRDFAITRERSGYHVHFNDGRDTMGPFSSLNNVFDAIDAHERSREALELLNRVNWPFIGLLVSVPLSWAALVGTVYLVWCMWGAH